MPSLLQSDLPHIEEGIRKAGARRSLWADEKESSDIVVDKSERNGKGKPVTSWIIVKALWRDRQWAIFISKRSLNPPATI